MAAHSSDDALIDRFVIALNRKGLDSLPIEEVPRELRDSTHANWPGASCEWQIRPGNGTPWISQLEEALPFQFPRLFRSFVTRYLFSEFEVGPIMFFANTGQSVTKELSQDVFVDKHLYPTLFQAGYLQFGRQAGGGYDPVCFAMKRAPDSDAPIVQLDHEEVLIHERIRIVRELAPSFRQFVEEQMRQVSS